MKNSTMAAVRDYIRQPYAWPGGYPRVLIMADGEPLCSQCARENYKEISFTTRAGARNYDWFACGVYIYWEGEPLHCSHCEKVIESAYGEITGD